MKKQLLDPLGSLCKCISLIFHNTNTKISIQEHILTLQEHSNTQFLIRFCQGDGKENISELYYVITRIIQWYIIPHNNLKNKKISNNFNYSNVNSSFIKEEEQVSIEKTAFSERNNYEEVNEDSDSDNETSGNSSTFSHNGTKSEKNDSNVILSNHNDYLSSSNADEIINSDIIVDLVKYICRAFEKLQETYQSGNVVFALQYFIIILRSALNGTFSDDMLPNNILKQEKEYQTLLDYDKIRNLWDFEKLNRIKILYDQCIELHDNNYDGKSDKTKKTLIKSYLDAIYSILDDNDKEFQILISNSNKG